jgi:GNAT superfamily N-acetyltransferase
MVERRAPAVGDGLETLRAAPAGLSLNDKLMIGIDSGPMLIGVVDLLRNFPSRDAWYIGLMLLTPSRRAGGLGSAVYAALADWVRGQGGKTIRLVVQFENVAGLRFWIRQGFAEIGSATQDLGTHINQVRRMECRL